MQNLLMQVQRFPIAKLRSTTTPEITFERSQVSYSVDVTLLASVDS